MENADAKPWAKWAAIALTVLLLVAVAIGGVREHTHIKTEERLTLSVTIANRAVTEAQERAEKAVKERDLAIKRSRKTHKIVWPDGRVEEFTEDTEDLIERTRETIEAKFTSKIDTLTSENVKLTTKVSLLEKDVTKSAPRWMAGLDIPVFDYANITAYSLLGGINIGPLTVGLRQPFAWRAPTLQAMIRF